MRKWWRRYRQRREVNRPIPWPYSSLMTDHEKEEWRRWGNRVTYWVCPTCGARRKEGPPYTYVYYIPFPRKTCDCPGY